MSESAIQAFKDGRRKISGWGNIYTREYKNGITYQSSYELKFLKYIDDNNLLDKIENGGIVSYFVNDKEYLYYIDFKIKDIDVVFEIKSTYIWNKKEDINILKMEAASKIYKYHLILDNNFDNVINIINGNI